MSELYLSGARCAYELCKRSDPIEIIPGHRRKLYHDDNCRQAQHRLLADRKVHDALSQLWSAFLPETQALLEDLFAQHGEIWARRTITAISTERDQAQQLLLTEDELAALRQQWAEYQPFTRNIFDGLVGSRHDALSLFNLMALAIGEEQRHASCNSELEQRNAYLEMTLADYRRVIDLDDREKIRLQFMSVGQLLGYRALPKHKVGEGAQKWEDYASWTHEETLAEVVISGREILAEEMAVSERAQEKSRLRLVEKELAQERTRREELEQCIAKLQARIQEFEAPSHASDDPKLLSREEMVARLLALGERLQFCRLLAPNIPPDPENWRDWAGKADDEQLRQAIASAEHYHGNLVYLEELEQLNRQAARDKQQQKSRVTQLTQECQGLRQRIQELEAAAAKQQPAPSALTAIQAYFHTHMGGSIPLQRGKQMFHLTALRSDGVAVATGQGLVRLSYNELHQLQRWIEGQPGAPAVLPSTDHGEDRQVQAKRVVELEKERAEWIAWKEAEVRGQGDLVAMRDYLQEHEQASIPILRNGVTVKIVALGVDAVAVTEDHGVIRLNDEELQQGRVWICRKTGTPIIATKLPLGEPASEGLHRLHIEQELAAAQAENLALHRELAKYLPPPRALLEATLRRWCELEKLPYRGKTLAEDEIEPFLRESSDRRVQKFIETAEHCYFIGKHRRRRIALIQQHLAEIEPYQGDPALRIVSMDDQGYVVFANGSRSFMDTDGINRFWARITKEKGQQTVGGIAHLAPLQRYLCNHPGQSIEIHCGDTVSRIVVIDDDALAITDNMRLMRLYDYDIEQAQRWLKQQGSVVGSA